MFNPDGLILNAENYLYTALDIICDNPDYKDRYHFMACVSLALAALSELDLSLD